MPRPQLIRSDLFPYHVTARTNNRADFPVPTPIAWEIICDSAYEASIVNGAEFHAILMMPNHLHALLSTPSGDIGVVMRTFMTSVSKAMNRLSGQTGHVFGGPYYPSIVRDDRYFTTAYRYVYQNPIRASLGQRVEEYRWSTLRGLLGVERSRVPLHLPRAGFGLNLLGRDADHQLEFLNRDFSLKGRLAIRKGLRTNDFSPAPQKCVESGIPSWKRTLSEIIEE
jgi:putative transposase